MQSRDLIKNKRTRKIPDSIQKKLINAINNFESPNYKIEIHHCRDPRYALICFKYSNLDLLQRDIQKSLNIIENKGKEVTISKEDLTNGIEGLYGGFPVYQIFEWKHLIRFYDQNTSSHSKTSSVPTEYLYSPERKRKKT